MKKKVWFINHYSGHMPFYEGGRHYWFSKYLARKGYEPVVFCSNTKHNPGTSFYFDFNGLWKEHVIDNISTRFVYVKSTLYKGNGIDRLMNMYHFYVNVKVAMKEYSEKNGNPDIIIASSVHPLSLVAGIQMAKHFNVKCICEIRDLWPEAIIAYSKLLKKNCLISRLLYLFERLIYYKSDALVFTQEGGKDYILSHGWDKSKLFKIKPSKVFHINNGVDLEGFNYNLEHYWFDEPLLDDNSFFKVVYAGAISRINNLGIIVDAAKHLNDSFKIIIFGDGNERERLSQRLLDENINNVVFMGKVNKKYIPSIVSRADCNLVHWEMNPMLKVGESYNKAFEYYAAGKPIFYTIKPGYSIAEKYQAGFITDGFTPEKIAKGIVDVKNLDPQIVEEVSNNAKKVALEYDFKSLTKKLIEIIEYV